MKKIILALCMLTTCLSVSGQWYNNQISALRSDNVRLHKQIDSLKVLLSKYNANLNVKSWDDLEGVDDFGFGSNGVKEGETSEEYRMMAARIRLSAPFLIIPFNERIVNYIDYYGMSQKRYMPRILSRYEKYLPVFQKYFSIYGVPEDLMALCIVESAVSAKARSRVGAYGMWQFMPATARQYGLQVNELMDEREDIERSTEAAAKFLSDNYRALGSWPLAVIAYNCGVGNVRKAIIRNGGSREYWDLHSFLPEETQGYLLSLIAIRYIMSNKAEFGLSN